MPGVRRREMAATSPLLALMTLATLVSQTVSRSARREASCPTLCVIDQTQGRILRLVEGTWLPEVYTERCEAPCTEQCLISQDPQTPQIVAHICSPDSVLCNHQHDKSCRRHVVVSMEHRIPFSVGGPEETSTGPTSPFEGSTTLHTKINYPSPGLIETLGTATTSWPWISSQTTSSTSRVEFGETGATESYVTVSQAQDAGCSETSSKCPTKGEFCFGVVMKQGEISYGCFPDKPVCSSIEGCIRVCLPSLESCLKTVSPSVSWGSSTVTPEPSQHIPDPPVPTENSQPEEDETEEDGQDMEDEQEPDVEDDEDNYTISEESEPDLSNDWTDSEEDEEVSPGENETEKKPDSASVVLKHSVLLYLALVLSTTVL